MAEGRKRYGPSTFPTYRHAYEDGRAVQARLYPNSLLPDFRAHFSDVWLPKRAREYFNERDKAALPYLVWCLTNTLMNLRVLLAVGCVSLPRVVHALGRPQVAPTRHRALPTTKMPSHLHNRICETPH